MSLNGRQKSYKVKLGGKESKWQAELISIENGRQNWQANSYLLKMAGNESQWQAEVISSEFGRQRVQMAGKTILGGRTSIWQAEQNGRQERVLFCKDIVKKYGRQPMAGKLSFS